MSDEPIPQKRCSKCSEIKPLNAFSNCKSSKDGRKSGCKACRKQEYWSNPEKARAQALAYRNANLEKVRQKNRDYWAKNIERIREKRRQNAERIRERRRDYRQRNADTIRESLRAWRTSHKEHIKAYRNNNLDLFRAACQQRRARIKGNGGTFTERDLKHLRKIQAGICAYCQGQHDPDALTIDHVIPIDHGGRHELANIVLACGVCNSSKNNRTPEQWTNRWYERKASRL